MAFSKGECYAGLANRPIATCMRVREQPTATESREGHVVAWIKSAKVMQGPIQSSSSTRELRDKQSLLEKLPLESQGGKGKAQDLEIESVVELEDDKNLMAARKFPRRDRNKRRSTRPSFWESSREDWCKRLVRKRTSQLTPNGMEWLNTRVPRPAFLFVVVPSKGYRWLEV